MSVPTEEERDKMILNKVRGLAWDIETADGDYQVLRNRLAIQGGPVVDPSDYASLDTVKSLVKWLVAYPRSGGIT